MTYALVLCARLHYVGQVKDYNFGDEYSGMLAIFRCDKGSGLKAAVRWTIPVDDQGHFCTAAAGSGACLEILQGPAHPAHPWDYWLTAIHTLKEPRSK